MRQILEFCNQVFHRFRKKMAAAQALRHDCNNEATLACTMRSSYTVVKYGWTINMDATACNVTDVRRLD